MPKINPQTTLTAIMKIMSKDISFIKHTQLGRQLKVNGERGYTQPLTGVDSKKLCDYASTISKIVAETKDADKKVKKLTDAELKAEIINLLSPAEIKELYERLFKKEESDG